MNALIIGGGIIGLSIARELRLRGAGAVTILESGRVGREASWAAAGMLSPNLEMSPMPAFFELCRRSNELFPEFAADLLLETEIDVELDRSGTILAAFSEGDLDHIEKKYSEQQAAGARVVRLSGDDAAALEPNLSESALGGLFYPEDGRVNNRRLMPALEEFTRRNDIVVTEGIGVNEICVEKGRATGCLAGERTYSADVTIVTTGAWTSLIKLDDRRLAVNVEPVKGQMLSFDGGSKQLRHGVCSPRGYIVPRNDGMILAGATVENAGFDKDVTAEGIKSLTSAAIELLPWLENIPVCETWAGLRPFAPDGLPIIGKPDGTENLFVATGHYRNGILLAPVTAKAVADMIFNGTSEPLLTAFSPNRAYEGGKAARQV